MKSFIVVLFLVLSTTAGAISKKTSKLVVPADQLAMMKEARVALALVAKKSAGAKEQLALYDSAAVMAKYEPDTGTVRVVTAPTQKTWFMLAVDTKRQKIQKEGGIYAEFVCRPYPVMFIRSFDGSSPFIHGVVLAHELEHARDCLLNNEPDSTRLDPNWLLGEMHAHIKVNQILNEWSDGGWMKVVNVSRERREIAAIDGGHRPESSVFAFSSEDRKALKDTFHVKDDVSMGTLAGQLDVDANLLNVQVQMEKLKQEDEKLMMERSIEVLRRFYTQQAAKLDGQR